MAGHGSEGPVAEFCAALRRLQQASGLTPAELVRRLGCGKSRLYDVLNGKIRRPPEWDRLVEPLVRACTGNDGRKVAAWRRRHGVLVDVYTELRRTQRERTLRDSPVPKRMVPAQLPADVDVFTGRAAELAELDGFLLTDRSGDSVSTAVVISAVSGTAGVGKTALALRWAHRVRRHFPDGQLYVSLRGYDPDQPLSAGDALAGFLRALGMAGQDIPLETAERATAYRSLLDSRRILIVLDNAATVEQIRPLLPGTPSAVVVVTSRDSLAGLVARHGARRLDLDLLPAEDAVALLRELIGERVEAEPDAAAALARQCVRLPLALRVAAELAISRPASELATLVAELADEQRRLDLLDAGGDPRTAIRAVFSWSYRNLPTDAARTFRLIGLHPGPDLDPYAAAALTHTELKQAQNLLDLLTRWHLTQYTISGRYSMHDLLRAYAVHLAFVLDSESERYAALTRLFDYYLATTAAAMDTLYPIEQDNRPRISPAVTSTPSVADPVAARGWIDAERATLTTVCAHTAIHGWPDHATRLAITLFRYLEVGSHHAEALIIHAHALRAAPHSGDPAAEARALTSLGGVHWQQARYEQAGDHFHRALELYRKIGNRVGEARVLGNLGGVYEWQGNYEKAVDHDQQALLLFREIGDRVGEAHILTTLGTVCQRQGFYRQAADHHQQALSLSREIGHRLGEALALTNLGAVHQRQGRNGQATYHHEQSLALFRKLGDRDGEALALDNLGLVHRNQGHYAQASDYHRQALLLSREIGDQVGEALALDNLGLVHRNQGHYAQASDYHRQALLLFREIGDSSGEVKTLNGLGEAHQAAGCSSEANRDHTAALDLATQIGDRYEQARGHSGLARIYHAAGGPDQARYHLRQALALYTELGVPDVGDVRDRLAVLDHTVEGEEPG